MYVPKSKLNAHKFIRYIVCILPFETNVSVCFTDGFVRFERCLYKVCNNACRIHLKLPYICMICYSFMYFMLQVIVLSLNAVYATVCECDI